MSKVIDWSGGAKVVRDTTAEEARVVTAAMVEVEAARRLRAIASNYLPEERETWGTQVEEAKAIKADATADAPILAPRATARGVTVTDMADRVLLLASQYATAAGGVLAARDALVAIDPIPLDYTNDTHWT